MIRKTLIGFAATAALLVGSVALVTPASAAPLWKAMAVNQQGDSSWSWNYSSEESARDAAITLCENSYGYDCSAQTTSVPMTWQLVAADCVNGDGNEYYSTGSSQGGYAAALQQATINANRNSNYSFEDGDCNIILKK